MRHHALLRPRFFVCIAALLAATATAADEEPPYFSVEFPGWVQQVAAGADGTVYAAGVTNDAQLPGTVVPPVAGQSPPCFFFVSAWSGDGRLLWTTYMPFKVADYAHPGTRDLRAVDDGSVWVAFCAQGVGPYADDVCVVRVGGDGSILTSERLSGSGYDRPAGLAVTAEGDAIVAGTTSSRDFPTTDASSWSEGMSAAFAARVRADGSGVAWSRLLGDAGTVRCTAAAADGSGGLLAGLAVTPAQLYQESWESDDLRVPYLLAGLRVERIAEGGAVVETTPLPHAYGGGVRSIALCADGSMLVAGMTTSTSREKDAFVMRVLPGTGEVTARWQEPCHWNARGAQAVVEPSGDVLVGTALFHVNAGNSYSYLPPENLSRIRRLTPDLREKETLFGRDGRRSLEQFVVSPGGAVCVAGHGLGVSFHSAGPPMSTYSSFVARVPAAGTLPPQTVSIRGFDDGHIHLAWRGGDAAERYLIEQSVSPHFNASASYAPFAEVPGHFRDAWVRVPPVPHVNRITAGSQRRYRIVAEFSSGVRMAGPEVVVPMRPRSLRARWGPTGVRLHWWANLYLRYEHLELERRLDGGPWHSVRPFELWNRRNPRSRRFTDSLQTFPGATVEYRLRTLDNDDRGFSAWRYSGELRVAGD